MDKGSQLSEEKKRLLAMRLKGAVTAKPAPAFTRREYPPLSSAQHQMWLIEQMNPGIAAYHIPVAYRIGGILDVPALQNALNEIIRRHEAWRTTFHELDGVPVQRIHPSLEIRIATTDLCDVPPASREDRARALAEEEAVRPFNLRELPLIRVSLLRMGDDDHVLILNVHHIVADGLSLGLMFDELDALYRAAASGSPSPLPALPAQYADFSSWQEESLASGRHSRQLAYWREQLNGELPVLELAAGNPRPQRQSFEGSTFPFRIPQRLAQALTEIGLGERSTFFVTILAAFHILLTRSTRAAEVIIGSPVAQRPLREFDRLIGNFLNIVALRSDLQGDPSFVELLRRCKEATLLAMSNADVPFETVVQSLGIQRDAGRNPVFQTLMQVLPHTRARLGDMHVGRFEFDARFSQVDLTLYLYEEADGGYFGQFQYCTALFSTEAIGRLAENFLHLLGDIAREPSTPISRLSILGDSERELILAKWSGTARPYPEHQTIADRFAECAARNPGAIAIIEGDERLTYAQLDSRANRIAYQLHSQGVRAGEFVGLRAERSLAFVVKVLGIAKAGAAYLPLDQSEPAARLATMRSACRQVLDAEPEGGAGTDPVIATAVPDGPAYVLHTSGSTGAPKGVIVPHTGIMRLVVNNDYAPFLPDDIVAFASNACFDAATFEIWGALLNGATLVITPRELLLSPSALAAHISRHRISVMFLTTSLFNRLAHESPAMFAPLRMLVFGGEAADPASVRLVLAHGKPQRLVNGYGPTETTTFAICHTIESADGTSIPIGRPIANTRVLLLDPAGQPVPVGVPGEIHIGGPGVALGYHAEPELTAGRFISTPHGRLYRTGDLARWLTDGTVEYLGRIDQQVKLRGFRIELGEIEGALQKHTAVREAAVIAREDASAGKQLFGYVTCSAPCTAAALRDFLRDRLPDYMVPSAIIILDALPLSANGKLDWRALPSPETQPSDTADFVAPRTELESRIARIWCDILKVPRISVHDNFFDLGGDSLRAMQIVGRLRGPEFPELNVFQIFERPTVGGFAAALDTPAQDETREEGML